MKMGVPALFGGRFVKLPAPPAETSMKLHHWVGSALVALAVASCNENNPPPSQSQPDLTKAKVLVTSPSPVATTANPAKTDAAKAAAASAPDDAPIPPANAQWTIFCDSVSGVGHIENARILRSRLVTLTGLHGWYVIHSDRESSLYYGYYRDDAADKKRAEADRLKVANLSDRYGNHLVRGGLLQPIVAPDPAAPLEWNLVNTPKNSYWSIEIATFAGNPKRKEAAVQMVRELRTKGETQAYYFHGPTVSSVCIGAWPREAVAEQGTGIDHNGQMRDDAHSTNPDQSLLVFGGFDQAPPNVAGRILEPGTNKPMAVEGKRLDIQDPTMKQKTVDYQYHFVNYELHGAQNGNATYPDSSVLVAIPHQDAAAEDESWRLTGGRPNSSTPAEHRPAPSGAGDNVLRSIGDH
jgi:hypothetical protein